MTDTNGMQEFFMHAQKDMNTVVENNETHKVLGPMRTVLVATGSEEKQIPQGNLTETIAERSTTATTVEVTTPAKDGGGGTQVYGRARHPAEGDGQLDLARAGRHPPRAQGP